MQGLRGLQVSQNGTSCFYFLLCALPYSFTGTCVRLVCVRSPCTASGQRLELRLTPLL